MTTWNPSGTGKGSLSRAFTLIELLVVITILAILVALLLPALKDARAVAKQLSEGVAAKELQLAYTTYSNDNKEKVIMGYLVWDWAHPGNSAMLPPDDAGRYLEGTTVKRWAWHLMPWLDYDFRAIIHDKRMLNDIMRLPRANGNRGALIVPGTNTQEWALSENPSFAINGTFVGGHWGRGAFRPVNLRRYGRFYVTKQSDAVFPSRLLVFGSARGRASWGGNYNEVKPGYYELISPYTTTGTSYGWLPSNNFVSFGANRLAGYTRGTWNPTRPPEEYGHMDFRHFNKSVTSYFDGHVENIGVREAADMRRWSDQAEGPNWRPVPIRP